MNARKKKILIVTAVTFAAVLLITGIVLLCLYYCLPRSDPKYVAHRGYSKAYRDNTAEAFLAASERGFYGIETDIRETKDGVFVCNHDETVKYASGEEKKVSDCTYAELAGKPLLNTVSNDEAYLCTFKEYLEICKKGDKVAVIELKEDFDATHVQRILEIVDESYDRKKVSIISFYFEALLRVKRADNSVNLQYLSETKNDPVFDRCLQENISIDVRQSIMPASLVKKFHEKGLTVNVWTVNKDFDLSIVRIKQVDYVTTDRFSGEK